MQTKADQGFIWSIYLFNLFDQKYCKILYLKIFYNGIYSCDAKVEFSAAITWFLIMWQLSVPHDTSEIILICWFGAQKHYYQW